MVSTITIVWTKINAESQLFSNIFEFYEFPDPHRKFGGHSGIVESACSFSAPQPSQTLAHHLSVGRCNYIAYTQ